MSHDWMKTTWLRGMSHVSVPDPWPGHSSSTHLGRCCTAQVLSLSPAFLVSQRLTKGDSNLLPFAYLLLGKHYSYLKTETLEDNVVLTNPVETVNRQYR